MSHILYATLEGVLLPELINIVRLYCDGHTPKSTQIFNESLLPPSSRRKGKIEIIACAFLRGESGENRLLVATRQQIFEITEDDRIREWNVSFRNIDYLTVIRRRSQDVLLVSEEILGVSLRMMIPYARNIDLWLVNPKSGKQRLHLETRPASTEIVGFGDRLYSMNSRCLELHRVDKKNKCRLTRRAPELVSILDYYQSIAVDAYSNKRRVYTHCSSPSRIIIWTQDLVPINTIDIHCRQMTVIPLVPDYTGTNTQHTSYLAVISEEGLVRIFDPRDERQVAEVPVKDRRNLIPCVGALAVHCQSGDILTARF